jgi:glutamate synthase domain-containing protein 3
VLDEQGKFPALVNREMVELESPDAIELDSIRDMIRRHVDYTGSVRGQYVLDNWDRLTEKFVKVMPIDYKRALEELRRAMEETAKIADAGYDAAGNGSKNHPAALHEVSHG